MGTLVRRCLLVSALNGKDSPPNQSEVRQGKRGAQLLPNCPRPGVAQWLLGQRQPRRPSWGRRATGEPGEMDRKRGRVWMGKRTVGCSPGLRDHGIKSQVVY